jgi:hypothetical protein
MWLELSVSLSDYWAIFFLSDLLRYIIGCCQHFFIIITLSGVRLSPLGTAATTGRLCQPQMTDDGDCGRIGRMKFGRGNRSTRRKSAPAPLCPPQIPHDQTQARTRAVAWSTLPISGLIGWMLKWKWSWLNQNTILAFGWEAFEGKSGKNSRCLVQD